MTVFSIRGPSQTLPMPRPLKYVPAVVVAIVCVSTSAQAPPTIDTTTIGPKIGATVPSFAGTDQFGRRQTLESTLRARGAMLVFFRSADW